jgi:hypothetical protein
MREQRALAAAIHRVEDEYAEGTNQKARAADALQQKLLSAFGEESLSGFKNRFARYFGTDHMLLEGWRTYLTHLKPKPDPDDDIILISFYSGAMPMFKSMLKYFSANETEQVLKRIKDTCGVDVGKLWEGHRAYLADEIGVEILDQYKRAFFGGAWFISATAMVWPDEKVDEYFVRGMEALRDEINEFRTDMELWAMAKVGGRSP